MALSFLIRHLKARKNAFSCNFCFSSASLCAPKNRLSSRGIDWKSSGIIKYEDTLRSHLRARNYKSEVLDTIPQLILLEKQRIDVLSKQEEWMSKKKDIAKLYKNALKTGKVPNDSNNNANANLSSIASTSSSVVTQPSSLTAIPSSSTAIPSFDELKHMGEEVRHQLHAVEVQLEDLELQIIKIFQCYPNLLNDMVPDGNSEQENKVLSTHMEDKRLMLHNSHPSKHPHANTVPSTNTTNKVFEHDELLKMNGWYDLEAASRLSGTRFSILCGHICLFERILTQYLMNHHVNNQYMEVTVPYIVTRKILEGTGHLPKFQEELYQLDAKHVFNQMEGYLIPTAEVPVTGMFASQIFDANKLPLSYVCHTPCFRAEAGAYGKDTKGIIRQHQFHKIELVKLAAPATSMQEMESMCGDVQEVLRLLELPYRKLLLCSGDTGFAASITYDLEVWFPSQDTYREISSISNCTDFQTKRLHCIATADAFNISRKDRRTQSIHPHTINGSGVAIGRLLAAILENYQTPTGQVRIPSVLLPLCPVSWQESGVIPATTQVQKITNHKIV